MKKQTAFTIFIAALFVLFVGFAVAQWYPEPDYPTCYDTAMRFDEPQVPTTACDGEWDAYQSDMEDYSKTVAMILLGIGIGAMVFGLKSNKFEKSIQLGIVWGGILTIFYGVFRYWNYIDDSFRPIILGVLLVGAIYLGNKYKRYLK